MYVLFVLSLMRLKGCLGVWIWIGGLFLVCGCFCFFRCWNRGLIYIWFDVLCNIKGVREGMKRERGKAIRVVKKEGIGYGWKYYVLVVW